MTLRIMLLDMFKLRRLAERRVRPVKMSQPAMQMRIPRANVPNVALEMLHVDGVEAHDRGEQPHVHLGESLAEVIRALGGRVREVLFRAVERSEELGHGFLVGFLRGCEAALVNPVIHVVVRPGVHLVDLLLQIVREEDYVLVLLIDDVVEGGVKHADDLGGFVAHDRLLLLVPEGGHREAALIVGLGAEVQIAEVCVVWMQRIWGRILAGEIFVLGREAPAWRGSDLERLESWILNGFRTFLGQVPMHAGDGNDLFQPL